MACLHDFIDSLPEKYDTIVGEGGISLSGGQRQRLAIARAFVQKTEIILFDEATSALDNETQSKIQEAINNLQKEYTILIIAHRLSTVVNCDRILFLNNGQIEAEATHEQLLRKSKEYKHLPSLPFPVHIMHNDEWYTYLYYVKNVIFVNCRNTEESWWGICKEFSEGKSVYTLDCEYFEGHHDYGEIVKNNAREKEILPNTKIETKEVWELEKKL